MKTKNSQPLYRTGNLSYVEFKQENNITYIHNNKGHKSIPAGIKFYPYDERSGYIWLRTEKYELAQEYMGKLVAHYKNNIIAINPIDIPSELLEFLRNNFIQPI